MGGSATEALNSTASSGPSILTGSGEMSNVANGQSRASSEPRPGLGKQSTEILHIATDELAAKIEPELLTLMRIPDNLNKRIILIEELEKFWRAKDRDQFYRRWFDEAGENQRQLLRIISILILARFRRWDEFYEIFVMNEKRKTRDRPFQLDDLSQAAFLGPADGQQFYQHQWIFWPLVIRERREAYILAESEQERRLPFIADRTKIGEGATAGVFMETIMPGRLTSGRSDALLLRFSCLESGSRWLVSCKRCAKSLLTKTCASMMKRSIKSNPGFSSGCLGFPESSPRQPTRRGNG